MRVQANFRFFRSAFALPAALAVLVLALQACSTTRNADGTTGGPDVPVERLTFKVDVVSANRRIRNHLEEHLDIQRFTNFPDLQASELRRLLGEAESNARDLLAALGYFQPTLALTAGDPDDRGTRRIVIDVDPGEQTRIASHVIEFAEPMNSDEESARQRRVVRREWLLQDENPFTQEEWDAAKTAGLRTLQRERYPTARIASSQATVNADTNLADLAITYDAGPAYTFGELELEGVERYDPEGIRNIARIPTGDIYTEDKLLDAQQRLIASGYFDSAFLLLDNSDVDPDAAAVIAQLREAEYQKIIFGLGFSTDAGPRVSIDHTHNKMWPLGWRAQNQIAIGTNTQSLKTNWTDMPKASGWAWYTGLALERSEYGDVKANSVSLNGGRSRSADSTDRRYYLQYDASKAEGNEAPGGSSSLLGNYAWTGRYFNDRLNPTRGFGVGLESGIGLTVTPNRDPFLRVNLRGLYLWPFGGRNLGGNRSRLALRAEFGGIYAGDNVNIPVPLLFLTGGDTTVRGYGYQSIGTRLDDGSVYGARYMAMGSVEWQRPITLFGDAESFEHTVFVDAGTAADKFGDAEIFPGVGTGMRWRSPVGPLQADVGYGTKEQQWRVHVRIGFQF